SHVREVRVI
ncbi:unnamed protein product, partial [Tilletia laevis]